MNTTQITVADIIKFLQTIPPETKVRVLQSVSTNWETTVEFTNVVQYGGSQFNIESVDGITYWKEGNTIDFGIN